MSATWIKIVLPLVLVPVLAAAGGGDSPRADGLAGPARAASAAAFDEVDSWRVYLDERRVLEAWLGHPRPPRPTLAELRRARVLGIDYFTDGLAEFGARVSAHADGPGGRREIASRVIGPQPKRRVSFAAPDLLGALRPGERLVFRIEFPGTPQDWWAAPHDFLEIR